MDTPDIDTISAVDAFPALAETPSPPETLYVRGTLPNAQRRVITVVGSRRHTDYGAQACRKIITELAGTPVTIASGLAIGIDAIAHDAALEVGLPTVAFPGSGLHDSVLYPRTNQPLAKRILAAGGALVSEYQPNFRATKWSFPARNRIMAGIADAVLVIEAAQRSGTLITARLGTEYNRDVCAVPGSIFSALSAGTNQLIAQGAYPITCGEDLCRLLNLEISQKKQTRQSDLFQDEMYAKILTALTHPLSRNELALCTGIAMPELNRALTKLEMSGVITITGNTIVPLD